MSLANITQKEWKPFPRQEEFLRIPDSIDEGLYGGAAAGGKSECLLLLPIARGFYQHSRFKGIIFRRTYPELEKEIILRSFDYYPAAGGKYNDEKKRWTFYIDGVARGIMQFGHVEYEADVRKYDTTEYNYMAFDELTSFTEYQYMYLVMSRCRSSSRDLPAIARSGTNPGNIGHGWVRKRFIEPAPYGTIIKDSVTGLKRIFIQSKATDNPHIDPNYINRLSALPEAERRAKRDGDWWTFAGQVFDDWREHPLPGEGPECQHVVKEFEIPKWWPHFLAIDWGYTAMTCALWGALSPEGRLYIYREHTVTNTKIAVWATDIGRMSQEHLNDIVMCQSAWQDRGEALLIAEQFEKASGLRPRMADNNRLAGKVLLQEYLRYKQLPERKMIRKDFSQDDAAKVLRQYGMDEYKKYLSEFVPREPETNLPKLQVFRICTELIKTIPLCVYDAHNKEDVAEFAGDDPYDTIRYELQMVDAYGHRTGEAEHQASVAAVLQEFEQKKDYTILHRRMEHIERRSRTGRPIRRIGRSERVS